MTKFVLVRLHRTTLRRRRKRPTATTTGLMMRPMMGELASRQPPTVTLRHQCRAARTPKVCSKKRGRLSQSARHTSSCKARNSHQRVPNSTSLSSRSTESLSIRSCTRRRPFSFKSSRKSCSTQIIRGRLRKSSHRHQDC